MTDNEFSDVISFILVGIAQMTSSTRITSEDFVAILKDQSQNFKNGSKLPR